MNDNAPATIFIVSDGSGRTCRLIVDAALVQFAGHRCRRVLYTGVRTAEELQQICHSAAQAEATLFFTLASFELREIVLQLAQQLLVPAVDVLGPAFIALSDLYQENPGQLPGLLYETRREDFDRMDAIDYTLAHDDGQRPHELSDADVVLVGVSRASKSSTCFYLAYQGIKAANVPIVLGIPPLAPLLRVDPSRVIMLKINPLRLRVVREARVSGLSVTGMDQYYDKREIAREIRIANDLAESQGWRSIDVSYKAVEEIAKEVMRLVRTIQ